MFALKRPRGCFIAVERISYKANINHKKRTFSENYQNELF